MYTLRFLSTRGLLWLFIIVLSSNCKFAYCLQANNVKRFFHSVLIFLYSPFRMIIDNNSNFSTVWLVGYHFCNAVSMFSIQTGTRDGNDARWISLFGGHVRFQRARAGTISAFGCSNYRIGAIFQEAVESNGVNGSFRTRRKLPAAAPVSIRIHSQRRLRLGTGSHHLFSHLVGCTVRVYRPLSLYCTNA